MEEFRDDRLGKIMSWLQAWVRGYLARKDYKKIQEQRVALQVVQRNLRKYLQLRTWPWYKLWQKVKPLLNVTRVEDEIAVSIHSAFTQSQTRQIRFRSRFTTSQSDSTNNARVSVHLAFAFLEIQIYFKILINDYYTCSKSQFAENTLVHFHWRRRRPHAGYPCAIAVNSIYAFQPK